MTARRAGLQRAFDELRFGSSRTLNLREMLPSAADARRRAEAWLREKQVERAGDVLIITGRGSQSFGQKAVVREEIRKLLTALKRRGVVSAVREHTAGSFAVSLAPMRALLDAPRRHGASPHPTPRDPSALEGLSERTRARLRLLAGHSLHSLGIRSATDQGVAEEMARQFAILAAGLPGSADRERVLRDAIDRAIEEYEDHAR